MRSHLPRSCFVLALLAFPSLVAAQTGSQSRRVESVPGSGESGVAPLVAPGVAPLVAPAVAPAPPTLIPPPLIPPPLIPGAVPAPEPSSPRPTVMLVGYWPPSNEAIREFSTRPNLNPGGWIGQNWEGRGYDLHAYFPTFNPTDCDFCDEGNGIFMVDYQDTQADFWRVANRLKPVAIVSFSRGNLDMSWELEAVQYNRDFWFDDFVEPTQPSPNPPDPTVPLNHVRPSLLPMVDIVEAVDTAFPSLDPFICLSIGPGAFVSEYVAYHGVWYQDMHRSPAAPDSCITAGHVHLGSEIPWATARAAAKVTLREVLDQVAGVRAQRVCQRNLGFGGPGALHLRVCGEELSGGQAADIHVSAAPPSAAGFLLLHDTLDPTPFLGGHLIANPADTMIPFTADLEGNWLSEDFAGGGGPLTLYAQAFVAGAGVPDGVAISNVVELELLP